MKNTASATTKEFPVATASLLADHEKLARTHAPEQINEPLFSLIRARRAINDALLSCCFAARLNREDAAVSEALIAIKSALSDIHDNFPLIVAGKLDRAIHEWAAEPPAPVIHSTPPRKRAKKYDRLMSPAQCKAALEAVMRRM